RTPRRHAGPRPGPARRPGTRDPRPRALPGHRAAARPPRRNPAVAPRLAHVARLPAASRPRGRDRRRDALATPLGPALPHRLSLYVISRMSRHAGMARIGLLGLGFPTNPR